VLGLEVGLLVVLGIEAGQIERLVRLFDLFGLLVRVSHLVLRLRLRRLLVLLRLLLGERLLRPRRRAADALLDRIEKTHACAPMLERRASIGTSNTKSSSSRTKDEALRPSARFRVGAEERPDADVETAVDEAKDALELAAI